ncbi:MAG: DNA-directed RNA polymerase subunit alpha [Candidatus Staskawiczbacteria bacterium]|nr:DNA-directed RNA polymerase subunit alpha [Candidatus Staskawiczbacteria bacterium]
MISLPLPPKVTQKKKNQASFEVEGLYPGYGVTIGNALRRVLLTSLEGAAITEVKIKGAPHEFSTIQGILEDTIMILLNLKNLRFKIFSPSGGSPEGGEGSSYKIELKKKGEGAVTGSAFKCPSQVKLVNPDLHIATITDKKTELEIEIEVQKGTGYVQKDQLKTKKAEIGAIAVDAIFTPIKNVNFQVENMRVGDRTDFDRLSLEIETDGTITPEEAFFQACDILIKHFNIIFSVQGARLPARQEPALSGEGAKTSTKDKETLEKTEEADVAKVLVEDMKLTGRTLNALANNGIKTAGGIVKRSEKSLMELEGMGEKSMSEIKRKIKKLGLEFKGNEEA